MLMDSFLYLGSLRRGEGEELPSFTGSNLIPLSWYLLFSPEDIVSRRKMYPKSMKVSPKKMNLEQLAKWQEEPVAFRTTLDRALNNLREYGEAIRSIPYIWSYFRVLEILEKELEKQLEDEADFDVEQLWNQEKKGRQKRKNLSQVKVEEETKEKPGFDPSNPFAELEESFGMSAAALLPTVGGLNELGIAEDELIDVFSSLDELEDLEGLFEADQPSQKDPLEDLEEQVGAPDPSKIHITVNFHDLLETGELSGEQFARILVYFERLIHHARREGRMTRVMLEILQDIFREGETNWRITGQLSEDFLRDQPSRLVSLLLGSPSPFIVLDETFDLEYWTSGTLQPGDERLMYALTLLPSEEIHRSIKKGKFHEVASSIHTLLASTQQIVRDRLSLQDLELPPKSSNLWGFRVLIADKNGIRPGTYLSPNPDKTWREIFKEKLELPSVRKDWHITLELRMEEYTEVEYYTIEFDGAKSVEEAFIAFGRWVRRQQKMYHAKFGVDGTIEMLAQTLLSSDDQMLVLQIFDALNQLTEFGFNKAIEVLGNEKIISKITNLYA